MKAIALLPTLLLLAACTAEEPPAQHSALRETMQAPLDKARDAEAAQKQAQEERQRELDAAGQ